MEELQTGHLRHPQAVVAQMAAMETKRTVFIERVFKERSAGLFALETS
jgi:hypothetical protein